MAGQTSNMDPNPPLCSSTLASRDANPSQSAKSPGELGGTTSTAIAGEKSAFESTGVEPLAQSVKREEGESDVISQDDEGSQGEADMDICEESEDAEEWSETKDGIVKEETGGMEPGPIASEIPIPSKLQRFYFESDTLALKNNPDVSGVRDDLYQKITKSYQKLLKTLAILEAQKMQAIRDLEMLVQAQAKAEKDPLTFVEALKNGTLEPLPRRQRVMDLPDIEWKGYIESLQQVAKQHTSLYKTRRHNTGSKPLIFELDEKPSTSIKPKDPNKPASYRQPWTPEEQAKFEELLKIYPPEAVERKRYQKIAKAMGTRTTQQVATHVQKYFIKLANAGLPVPGRMPNMARYSRSKKGKGKRGGLRRPSTFFTSLMPNVFMTEESSSSTPGTSKSGSPSVEGSYYEGSSDEDSETSEILGDMMEGDSGSSSPHLVVKCCSCGIEVKQGVYWQCTECPLDSTINFCIACVNSDYRSQAHSPSHDLQPLTVTAITPSAELAGTVGGVACSAGGTLVDKDYASFETQVSQTSYNYLDPNFFPAS